MNPKRESAAAFWGALLLCTGLNLTGMARSVAAEAGPARQDLERIAYAVAGAESSYGRNPAMWRPNLAGPQGPMQVSEKAARDVGGGDRFDIAQRRRDIKCHHVGHAYILSGDRRGDGCLGFNGPAWVQAKSEQRQDGADQAKAETY